MAIKGFSQPKRIPRVGKIYLGEKQKNAEGKEYPVARDYFVVRADGKNTSEAAAKAFHEVYGDTPREMTVVFPSDDPENFMPQYLAAYRGSPQRPELWCKGNGETASRVDGNGGYHDIPCLYKECPIFQENKCKELTRLLFMLPEVKGLGIWELDTSSYYGSQNLLGTIQLIRKCTRGKIAMIPLTLRVVPQTVNPDGRTKTVYVVDLQWEDINLMDLLNRIPQLGTEEPMQLVEPLDFNEMPDDLYIERNMVTDSDIRKQTTAPEQRPQTLSRQPSTDVQPDKPATPKETAWELKTVRQDEVEDFSRIGAIANIEIREAKGRDVAKLTIAMFESGEKVDTITDNTQFLNAIRTLQTGTLVQFHSLKHENLSYPVLQDLAIVS
ncbi:hypothetical protein LLE49_22075 [Alicyclobacillus tolerans]|uniref:recombination directionality factor n=1 Tax=Alicyclobacillus tolerans TaxID=90970 RepID=UPI001F370E79|nr:hypothetical protein [Alicyclobacillus tolerans]MCF8567412.1 hypothetical protein [Alicyclobacillus tolerans]